MSKKKSGLGQPERRRQMELSNKGCKFSVSGADQPVLPISATTAVLPKTAIISFQSVCLEEQKVIAGR